MRAGNSSLLDRHHQVTPRAIRAGQIAQAAQRFKAELWQAHKEPLVGVFVDGQNDLVWSEMALAASAPPRELPGAARMGIGRALINAGVPFEHLTAGDLRAGLAARYRILCLPSVLTLPGDLLTVLQEYANQGGRLVMDLPSAWLDERLVLLNTERGGAFEKLFGVVVNELQPGDSHRPVQLDGVELAGILAELTPTHAQVLARYSTGKPAITEARVGRGTAVILGCQSSRLCSQPDNAAAESLLLRYTLGSVTPAFTCRGCIVFRLASPAADHYFLLNDGPTTQATLATGSLLYSRLTDAISGETLPRGRPITVEAYSGKWVRAAKP
jgi:beta-galactosidase